MNRDRYNGFHAISLILAVGPHPNKSQIQSDSLESKSNNPELHTDTARKATGKRLVAGDSVTSLCRSGDEIVVNIFNRVETNENTKKQCIKFNNRAEDEPIHKYGSKIQGRKKQRYHNHNLVRLVPGGVRHGREQNST